MANQPNIYLAKFLPISFNSCCNNSKNYNQFSVTITKKLAVWTKIYRNFTLRSKYVHKNSTDSSMLLIFVAHAMHWRIYRYTLTHPRSETFKLTKYKILIYLICESYCWEIKPKYGKLALYSWFTLNVWVQLWSFYWSRINVDVRGISISRNE